MNAFGLGIVLNFVDNATSGMNSATNTFMSMQNAITQGARAANSALQQMASGAMLTQLGAGLTNFGNGMLSVLTNVGNNVKTVGSEFQMFKITLEQLYGSAEAAEAQIEKLMNFSVKSPFEVAEVKDMLVVLKSQGIEAFDSIKGSISGAEQQTLQWLSDLMAFKPDVPAQRWKLAFQNFIGSGETKQLRNVLDMGKIDEILGHDIGSTVQERMNNLVEIVEKKNLTGLTQNMFGTMQQNISNISDFFTMFYKAIGDAGVFDALSQITGSVSKMFQSFDNESGKLTQLAQIVADGFNLILSPVVKLTDKMVGLVSRFLDFAIANPVLGKIAIAVAGFTGASIVAVGWVLRLAGAFMTLAGSFTYLQQSGALTSVTNALKLFGGKVMWLIPLAILLYQAWKNNFMGIQNVTQNVFKKLGLIWDYFKQGYFTTEQYNLAQQLGILDTIEKIAYLKYYWDYFKSGFAKGWNSAFSSFFKVVETGLLKIDATLKKLGVDVGIGSLLSIFDNLFKPGNEKNVEALGEAIGVLAANLIILYGAISLFKGVYALFAGLGKVGKVLVIVFKGLGKAVGAVKLGKFIGDLGAAISLVRQGNSVFSVFSVWFPRIAGLFTKMGGLFTTLGGWISTACSAIATAVAGLAAALGISVGALIAIILAVIAAIVLVIVFWDEICYFFTTIIPNAIKACIAWFANLWNTLMQNPVFSAIVNGIMSVVNAVWSAIKGVCSIIFNAIALIGSIIWGIIKVVAGVLYVIFQVVWGVLKTIIGIIWSIIKIVATVLGGIFKVVWTIISGIAKVIWSIIQIVWQVLRIIAAGVMWLIMTAWNFIKPIVMWIYNVIIQPIWNFLTWLFSSIIGGLGTLLGWIGQGLSFLWGSVSGVFTTIWNFLVSVGTGIGDFFSGVWNAISGWATAACDGIWAAFSWVSDKIKGFFDWITNGLGKIKDGLKGAADWVISKIPGFATGVESFRGGLAVINERGGELVDLPSGTRVIPHDKSIQESVNEGIRIGAKAMSAFNNLNSNGTPVRTATTGGGAVDNSVTFGKGSIVIHVANASSVTELEKMAEFIMRYIERKQKLRSLAVRH